MCESVPSHSHDRDAVVVGDGDDLDAAAQQHARGEDLTPLALMAMSSMAPPLQARASAIAAETRRADRRSDELLVAMREFNEIMRENNATMKAILQRLLSLAPEQ